MEFIDFNEDLMLYILDFAMNDYANACSLQRTSKYLWTKVQHIMTNRLNVYTSRNNVWFRFRTSTGKVDALCDVKNVKIGKNIMLSMNEVWETLKCDWNLHDVAIVICPLLNLKIDSLENLLLNKPIPHAYQLIFYIERFSMKNMLPFTCTTCRKSHCNGSSTFSSIMSKHRHKRSASYFFKNVHFHEDENMTQN